MRTIPKSLINSMREVYKVGARVVLIQMDDPQAPPVGTEGTVLFVDDIGTIHIAWDNGSSLGAVFGEDVISLL